MKNILLCLLSIGLLFAIVSPSARAVFAAESKDSDLNTANLSKYAIITNPVRDFNASGSISSLVTVPSNDISAPMHIENEGTIPYHNQSTFILAGTWNLVVVGGNISEFDVEFTEVSADGKSRHNHTLSNFMLNAAVPIILDISGTTFSGIADMSTDGQISEHNVSVDVTIYKHDVIKLSLLPYENERHFGGDPIYGVMHFLHDVE